MSANEKEARLEVLNRIPKGLLVGGRWVPAATSKTIPVYNPADGMQIAEVAAGEAGEIDAAVRAARAAFESGPWSRMPATERTRLIWKLSEKIEENLEDLALIETLDSGKLLRNTRNVDVPKAIENLRYQAGWATKINGETISIAEPGTVHAYTQRVPIGVVGAIVPWNSPLAMAVAKIAPALAAGCTVVLKPAEQTPLTALLLGQLILEAGIPEGVVNIVTGYGETAGAALASHPDVDKIAFTGSTETGQLIARAATGNMKRVTLELGGKSPVIVFPDADIDKAIEGVFTGIFSNSGQFCAAGSRLFVHGAVADRLLEGVAERAEALKVGPGIASGSQMGPLVSEVQLKRVLGFIDAGRKAGAKVMTGGARLGNEGYFVQPTVFANTTNDMSIVEEEIFGPVLSAQSFSDDDIEAIAGKANDTSYGLAAYIWTSNVSTAHKLANRIRAGSIRINGGRGGTNFAVPFGGFKKSGWGREYGREGVEAYTEIKSVTIAL